MRYRKCADYHAMSVAGAEIICDCAIPVLKAGKPFNLGLATGNTMIELYTLLAERFNREKIGLSRLQTWNLDEYASDEKHAVPYSHPLSYRRYMDEKLFRLFAPERGFTPEQAHFPDPADPAAYDRELEAAGGLDLQLLGIGFNGHIAFNEPLRESEISVKDYGELPTRVLPLTPETIAQNTKVTANGDASLVPRFAATMGMKPILKAKKTLLLACFAEQTSPLTRMLREKRSTPELPASYLLAHPDFTLVWTADKIDLEGLL